MKDFFDFSFFNKNRKKENKKMKNNQNQKRILTWRSNRLVFIDMFKLVPKIIILYQKHLFHKIWN